MQNANQLATSYKMLAAYQEWLLLRRQSQPGIHHLVLIHRSSESRVKSQPRRLAEYYVARRAKTPPGSSLCSEVEKRVLDSPKAQKLKDYVSVSVDLDTTG
ncbi:hypothetical protein D5086_001430 [Populus alba]|uniref:Uncharacterized protein n=1 Tax=Populus alba TaxID=43335 RepID=A0ACC4D088_POPAL